MLLDSLQKQTFLIGRRNHVADKLKKQSTVTRIKASGSTSSKKSAAKPKVTKTVADTKPASAKKSVNVFAPLLAIGRYFKGSWYELQQVRWPSRKATWGLTGAVIGFTTFFIVVILLLDAGFKYLFEIILG